MNKNIEFVGNDHGYVTLPEVGILKSMSFLFRWYKIATDGNNMQPHINVVHKESIMEY